MAQRAKLIVVNWSIGQKKCRKNPLIITRIVGGLGNQMFQYAAGRALAVKTGQEFKLDLSEMDGYKVHALQLDQLNIQGERATRDEIPFRPRKSFFGRVVTALKNRDRIPQIFEATPTFDPCILQWKGPGHLSGYWQSERYFLEYSDLIRTDFSLKGPMSGERQDVLAEIREAEVPVSVHVRRGDYVTNATANSIHGTCEPEWYRQAMNKISEQSEDPTFFVFSDDPTWARSNLPTYEKMIFVEPRADGKDAEDMHLMSSCRSHIIANSTFSWWGAWLNPRQDKRVIAPARWFRDKDRDSSDLMPAQWERL